MKVKSLMFPAVALSLALGGMTALPTVGSAQQQPIYGSQMMTEQERMEYQERMKNAKTEEERELIRSEHHIRMQERAKEQGITLPETPPKSKGMGTGTGSGMKKGSGMGTGSGSGMGTGSGMGSGSGGSKGMKKGG